MLERFLNSADAALVMELMRQAELSMLQLTEAVWWLEEAATLVLVLHAAPARLVLMCQRSGDEPQATRDETVPESVMARLTAGLNRETLWRRVRATMEQTLPIPTLPLTP